LYCSLLDDHDSELYCNLSDIYDSEAYCSLLDNYDSELYCILLHNYTSDFYCSLLDDYDPDVTPLYTYLLKELDKLGLLYMHMVEPRTPSGDEDSLTAEQLASQSLDQFRAIWPSNAPRLRK
jgi:hypothetical protein